MKLLINKQYGFIIAFLIVDALALGAAIYFYFFAIAPDEQRLGLIILYLFIPLVLSSLWLIRSHIRRSRLAHFYTLIKNDSNLNIKAKNAYEPYLSDLDSLTFVGYRKRSAILLKIACSCSLEQLAVFIVYCSKVKLFTKEELTILQESWLARNGPSATGAFKSISSINLREDGTIHQIIEAIEIYGLKNGLRENAGYIAFELMMFLKRHNITPVNRRRIYAKVSHVINLKHFTPEEREWINSAMELFCY